MKNQYKKKDANGNPLSEEIGGGFNKEHWKKVKEARENLTSLIAFKTSPIKEAKLKEFAKGLGYDNYAPIMRLLLDRLLYAEVETTKIDFIVQELSLKDEIIAELRQTNQEYVELIKRKGL